MKLNYRANMSPILPIIGNIHGNGIYVGETGRGRSFKTRKKERRVTGRRK